MSKTNVSTLDSGAKQLLKVASAQILWFIAHNKRYKANGEIGKKEGT
jgi:hypothetical protein